MTRLLWLLSAVEPAATETPAPEGHSPAEVLLHHVTDSVLFRHVDYGPFHLEPTKHLVFFIAAAGLVLVMCRLALRSR